jgi:hypothetical protein
MRTTMTATALGLILFATAPAFTSGKPECGNAAREQWLTEDAIRTKATELGY